ncbi:hypothetical protein D9M69_450400 [compost metagenome]
MQRIFPPAKHAAGGAPALDGIAQLQNLLKLLQQARLLPAQRPGQRTQGGRQRLGQLFGSVGQLIKALLQRCEMMALFTGQRTPLPRQFIEKVQLFGTQPLNLFRQLALPALSQQQPLVVQGGQPRGQQHQLVAQQLHQAVGAA